MAWPGHTTKIYRLAKGPLLLHPFLQREKGPFDPEAYESIPLGKSPSALKGHCEKPCSSEGSHTKGFVQIQGHYLMNAKTHSEWFGNKSWTEDAHPDAVLARLQVE